MLGALFLLRWTLRHRLAVNGFLSGSNRREVGLNRDSSETGLRCSSTGQLCVEMTCCGILLSQLIVVFFCSCRCLRLAVPILRAESRQLRALLSILPSLLNVGSHTPTLYFLYFMLDGRTGTWRRCTLAQWKLPLSWIYIYVKHWSCVRLYVIETEMRIS
jgi:hypothetical protein